ncbi:MAG: hypothetical protein ACTSU9_09555 [Promethearchaeota archaeon]
MIVKKTASLINAGMPGILYEPLEFTFAGQASKIKNSGNRLRVK